MKCTKCNQELTCNEEGRYFYCSNLCKEGMPHNVETEEVEQLTK